MISPEIRQKGIILAQLRGLQRMDRQVHDGFVSDVFLRVQQEVFVQTTLPRTLVRSQFRKVLLKWLSLASSAEPISTQELTNCARDYFCRNGEIFNRTEGDVVAEIVSFNQNAPRVANLRVHQVANSQGKEKGWFLASGTDIKLPDEDYQIMNLRAAGYSAKEISASVDLAKSTVDNRSSRLYKRLGVQGDVSAALLLTRKGLIDTRFLEDRIDLRRFRLLTDGQTKLMEALIKGQGETQEELARHLGTSPRAIGLRVAAINATLGTTGVMSKAGLTIGYWLYKKEGWAEKEVLPLPTLPELTKYQVEAIRLTALGLKQEEIASELQIGYKAVQDCLTAAYQFLGEKSGLGAVLSLINRGILNPTELVNGFNLSVFDQLTTKQYRVVQALATGVDASDGNTTLAKHLESTPDAIEQLIGAAGKVLGLNGLAKQLRIRLAVLYLAYQQKQKVITLQPDRVDLLCAS